MATDAELFFEYTQQQNWTLPPHEISSLTDTHERILSWASVVSGLCSVAGSSMIVYLVLTSARKTSYKRILLGLSICDIISSITWAVAPLMLPADSSQRLWARGTDTTCSLLGSLTQFAFSAIWYNGMLSYYYLFTVRFRVSPTTFARRFEPWVHISCIGFNLVTAVLGFFKDYFAEMELGQGCWIAEYPKGCDINGGCRGDDIGWVIGGYPVIFMFLSILVNNAVIYYYVRRTTYRSIDRTLGGRNKQQERIRAVATQAILYVGTFLMAYIWSFAVRLAESGAVEANHEADIFPLLFLNHLFLPMQGVFNLFVYSRPNYQRVREAKPEATRLDALWEAWFGTNVHKRASIDRTMWVDRMSRRPSTFLEQTSMHKGISSRQLQTHAHSGARPEERQRTVNFAGEVVHPASVSLDDSSLERESFAEDTTKSDTLPGDEMENVAIEEVVETSPSRTRGKSFGNDIDAPLYEDSTEEKESERGDNGAEDMQEGV